MLESKGEEVGVGRAKLTLFTPIPDVRSVRKAEPIASYHATRAMFRAVMVCCPLLGTPRLPALVLGTVLAPPPPEPTLLRIALVILAEKSLGARSPLDARYLDAAVRLAVLAFPGILPRLLAAVPRAVVRAAKVGQPSVLPRVRKTFALVVLADSVSVAVARRLAWTTAANGEGEAVGRLARVGGAERPCVLRPVAAWAGAAVVGAELEV